jgi:predicted unusual protein kinase regulating ubiquinone biosynthesis (AarF/ABC1/UbiB family)
MELLKFAYIFITELLNSIYTGHFDTEFFWFRCIQVNMLYTKFFQSLSGHYLFSSVHTIPYTLDEFVPTLPVHKILGSGLISIVYESEFKDKIVVVKTKRKDIEYRIQNSMDSLEWYIEWIHWMYPIPTTRIVFEEICDSFLTQLDYIQEVKNQKQFQEVASYSFIKTPVLIEAECNENQIVMTKIENKSISMLTDAQIQTSICNLIEMVLHLLTHHGLIHGDLHLGNILFHEECIGIIDFGFMIQLSPDQRIHMYELIKGLILHDYDATAKHTLHFVDMPQTLTSEEEIDVKKFIIHVFQKTMEIQHSFSVHDFYELNQKFEKYDITFHRIFYRIVMALHAVEALVSQIRDPNGFALHLAILLCVQDDGVK